MLACSRDAVLALEQGAELDSDGDAPDEVVGRTGRSERSFGEIIRIRVQPTMMRRAAIEIQSRPATWQPFDGGINAENVAAIARNLEARASRVERHLKRSDRPVWSCYPAGTQHHTRTGDRNCLESRLRLL